MEQKKKLGAHWKITITVSTVIAVGLALYFVIGKISHDTVIAKLRYALVSSGDISFAERYVVEHYVSREELSDICREVRGPALANYGCERVRELSSLCHFEYDQLSRSMDTIAVIDKVRELRNNKMYYSAFELAKSCSPDYFPEGDLVKELFDDYLKRDFPSFALKLADDILYSSYISADRLKRAREVSAIQTLTYDCEKWNNCNFEVDYLGQRWRNCERLLAACKERHTEESKRAIASINSHGLDLTRIMYALTLVNSGLTIYQALELLDAKQDTAKL